MIDNQMRQDESRRPGSGSGQPSVVGWFAALAVVIVLFVLGAMNVYVRATWHEVEDGVLWMTRAQGVTAAEIAEGTPAVKAGVHVGDVLLAIDGQPIDGRDDVVTAAHRSTAGTTLTYTLLRLGSREIVQVPLAPIPQGNSVLYFVLAAVGMFTLMVGASVRLRRPGDQSSLHFFWRTVAFFGTFTFKHFKL